jgi:DNA-binding response OmpR family regulator/DNA-binding CsgD family transcriptional regulator
MSTHEMGTILIVDDTPANLAFLSDALDQVGYKVLVATNGYNAINQLQLITPDLILLDVLMPGLDGFETCRRLQGSGDTRDIPIVFMTALDGTDDIVRGLGLGAVDYLTKPVNHAEVLARIAARLRCSRAIRQFQEAAEIGGDAFIAFDEAARVTQIVPTAQELIVEYLGIDLAEGMLLPDPLRRWLASPCTAGMPGPPPRSPWAMDHQGKRLTINATTCNRSGWSHLVLEEHPLRGPSPEVLSAAFGLTQREAEVILWVVKGKTNRDIGLILGMSPRTVNKHLEHIYIKLGVETRTAAANKVTATLN